MTKQKQQPNLPQSPEAGYTIIESLVAMIVVSVLMIAIAPVMAYSVATRVQARRMELATQAARTYIDALRVGAIRPNDATSPAGFPVEASAAPTSSTGLYCVDLDGGNPPCIDGSKKDFYVQGVRSTTANPTQTGYSLTVRVYRADGFPGTMTMKQQSVANSALGNPQAPLVVMQTEIPPTTQGGSSAYRSLCTRILDPVTKLPSTTACK
ncbi:MAG: prepilin-type N-terminal cleavage/methylation domain-containing protein [Microcoleus sp.]